MTRSNKVVVLNNVSKSYNRILALDTVSFDIDEGESWYFVHSTGPGRIEILKDHEPTKAHVAIKVRHFELACRMLAGKGIEFEPVKDFGRVKAIFLKQRDPAGHKVHLLYQALL